MSAELEKLEARIAAVLALLGEKGCYCECEHHPDDHGDDCARCLGCLVEAILHPQPSGQAMSASEISDLRARLAAAEAEAARLQRLFDDAGDGVCDVLGLIDHYQALSRKDLMARWDAEAMVSELRQRLASIALDASVARPESSGGQGVGPSASYHAMARALDRIATAALIGDEEGER